MSAPSPITAFGTRYPSIRAAAAAFNFPESTLRFRLKHGLEPEAALVATDKETLAFIGLDAKSYCRAAWSRDLVTTREIVEHYRPDLLAAYDASNPTGRYRPYRKGGDNV